MIQIVRRVMSLLFVCAVSGFSEITPIAVNELSGADLTAGELATLSNRLRSELIKTGHFKVMERGEMNAILTEQGFQQSGACDESSCMVEVGRLLGVQKIIAGSVGKLGTDFFTVSLRMIDVATGEILKSADYDYTGELSGLLTTGLSKAATILTGTSPQQIVTTPKPESPIEKKVLEQPITITSKPDNATITIGDLSGNTPFTGKLLPGNYTLTLSQTGFKSLTQKITVPSNTPFVSEYSLAPVIIKEKKPAKKGRALRIVSTIIGTSAAVLGIVSNGKVEEYNNSATSLHQKAATLYESSSEAVSLAAEYKTTTDNRTTMNTVRSIAYGTAGVSATLFAVSFAFGGKK